MCSFEKWVKMLRLGAGHVYAKQSTLKTKLSDQDFFKIEFFFTHDSQAVIVQKTSNFIQFHSVLNPRICLEIVAKTE